MCKVINYNLCKRGGLSESTSVSNAQNFSVKSNMVMKAQFARAYCALLYYLLQCIVIGICVLFLSL